MRMQLSMCSRGKWKRERSKSLLHVLLRLSFTIQTNQSNKEWRGEREKKKKKPDRACLIRNFKPLLLTFFLPHFLTKFSLFSIAWRTSIRTRSSVFVKFFYKQANAKLVKLISSFLPFVRHFVHRILFEDVHSFVSIRYFHFETIDHKTSVENSLLKDFFLLGSIAVEWNNICFPNP